MHAVDPSLSVIVPVRDGADTLPACLAAIVAAMPEDGELIVVDDGSTDDSGDLARQHGARVIRHERSRGTSGARNAGWRVAAGSLIAFVDADVEVSPGALRSMVKHLVDDPDLQGVNGIYALADHPPGLVTAFTNTSIVYQHRQHGARVSSAFTGLCMLRRSALQQISGWDERWASRYADDVFTRYVLPPRCIALDEGATGIHHKRVALRGLLRHRANIGWHYVRSLRSYWGAVRQRPASSVLDLRYPANTVLSVVLIGAAGSAVLMPGVAPLLLGGAVTGSLVVNARFLIFTLRHRGVVEAVLAWPLSVLEGGAFLIGMGGSVVDLLRAELLRADSPHADPQRADLEVPMAAEAQ